LPNRANRKEEAQPMSIPAYDPNNIFVKIMAGALPSHKVYEDKHTFVFMDIMPRTEGHALIVPKKGSRNILDADPDDLGNVISTVQKVARAAMTAFKADGISVAQFSEPAGGQVIFHTHFHVMPRWTGVEMGPPGIKGDDAKIAENARLLREALGS
jgi:histidine triad (HIT) family protein